MYIAGALLDGHKVTYEQGLENVKSLPEPDGQKFPVGSRVYIQKDLGSAMSHFRSGCWATVEYTYAHAYGGNDINSYSLIIDDHGSSAWYEEYQLHLEEGE